MIKELNHVGMFVQDAERSVKFYTELLEAKVVSEAIIPAPNTKCIYLQIASSMIELLAPADTSSRSKWGFDHVAYIVDNLDAEYARLSALGRMFSVPPKVAGSGRGRVAFFSDPNGVRVELIERDDTFRIAPIAGGQIHSIDHISLVANDLKSAERFYVQDMSMSPLKQYYIEARDLTMVYMNHGVDVIELLHRSEPQLNVDLIGHIALRVDNVDEMTKQLQARGVPFEPGSPKAAGTGLGRVSVFRDPDGAKIELVDRKDLREL